MVQFYLTSDATWEIYEDGYGRTWVSPSPNHSLHSSLVNCDASGQIPSRTRGVGAFRCDTGTQGTRDPGVVYDQNGGGFVLEYSSGRWEPFGITKSWFTSVENNWLVGIRESKEQELQVLVGLFQFRARELRVMGQQKTFQHNPYGHTFPNAKPVKLKKRFCDSVGGDNGKDNWGDQRTESGWNKDPGDGWGAAGDPWGQTLPPKVCKMNTRICSFSSKKLSTVQGFKRVSMVKSRIFDLVSVFGELQHVRAERVTCARTQEEVCEPVYMEQFRREWNCEIEKITMLSHDTEIPEHSLVQVGHLNRMRIQRETQIQITKGLQDFCEEREEECTMELGQEMQSEQWKPFALMISYIQLMYFAITRTPEREWQFNEGVADFALCKIPDFVILMAKNPLDIISICREHGVKFRWAEWQEVNRVLGCLFHGSPCGAHCIYGEEGDSSWGVTECFWNWAEGIGGGMEDISHLAWAIIQFAQIPSHIMLNPKEVAIIDICQDKKERLLVARKNELLDFPGVTRLKFKKVKGRMKCLFSGTACSNVCKYGKTVSVECAAVTPTGSQAEQ